MSLSVLHAGLDQFLNVDQRQLWDSSSTGSGSGSRSPLSNVILQEPPNDESKNALSQSGAASNVIDQHPPDHEIKQALSQSEAALKTCGEYCDKLGCRTMRAKHVRRLVCTDCMPVDTFKTCNGHGCKNVIHTVCLEDQDIKTWTCRSCTAIKTTNRCIPELCLASNHQSSNLSLNMSAVHSARRRSLQ
jgi:hypothetical protein